MDGDGVDASHGLANATNWLARCDDGGDDHREVNDDDYVSGVQGL